MNDASQPQRGDGDLPGYGNQIEALRQDLLSRLTGCSPGYPEQDAEVAVLDVKAEPRAGQIAGITWEAGNPDVPELLPDLGERMRQMISAVDTWLDADCAQAYKDQPLAQDWARTGKVIEELGEAIAELILATGQNPRKPHDPGARERLLAELADCAVTSVFAIQHFTKDTRQTLAVFLEAMSKAARRAGEAGYPS